ncbi:ABC transporter ATP-binding protein [Jeongeupia naejangsanensis]|uniref:ABC transporter ATP-binding protein n=1 Tax=Jeongeupia naejangsanensis TaxID=613195 RepID=A0ABS2BG93_9NEIS|nr:ABC transporter ATP-binding protein [Jeongeupia naejangsanensis]MBM3114632.1 ABC transporter ATP-binding protein [Jeongeupia naejangsanensis]
MKPMLEVNAVTVRYPGRTVIESLSFSLAPGQIGCLLGHSGCGKTTMLRAIAGFEALDDGEIRIDGDVVAGAGQGLPPEARRIGMVFQDYALFPHLNVADNIGFGLRQLSAGARTERVDEMLALVGLAGEHHRYPHELSGGQQQRVALARALAPKPRLMLLDEPFSNLDAELRERLGHEVRDILKAAGTTAILVTHDQHEAFAVADVVGVMVDGRIRQWASPYALYHQPVDRYVANFIGEGVLLPGIVNDRAQIEFELGVFSGQVPMHCKTDGCRVDVLVRPDDVQHDDASPFKAAVLARAFRGAEFLYTLGLPSGQKVLSLVPSHHSHVVGEEIGIRLEMAHAIAYVRE